MSLIRNANYDPTDRNSKRFIEVPDQVTQDTPVVTQPEIKKIEPIEVKPTVDDEKARELAKATGRTEMSTDKFMDIADGLTKVTPEERTQLENKSGIQELINARYTAPTKKTQDIFSALYESSDLKSIKNKIAEHNDLITKRKEAYLNAKKMHQNNP